MIHGILYQGLVACEIVLGIWLKQDKENPWDCDKIR